MYFRVVTIICLVWFIQKTQNLFLQKHDLISERIKQYTHRHSLYTNRKHIRNDKRLFLKVFRVV